MSCSELVRVSTANLVDVNAEVVQAKFLWCDTQASKRVALDPG